MPVTSAPIARMLLYPNRSASNPAIGIVAISMTMQSVLMSKAWGTGGFTKCVRYVGIQTNNV